MTRANETMSQVQVQGLLLDLVDLFILEVLVTVLAVDVCVIGRALRDLPEPYRGALDSLVSSTRSADEVAVVMAEAGLRGSASAIRLHRRDQCVCRTRGA